MKEMPEREIHKHLEALAKLGILDKTKEKFIISTKYKKAWNDALDEFIREKPKKIKSVDDANISAHLKALWICGYFEKPKSKDEIGKTIAIIDTWRKA